MTGPATAMNSSKKQGLKSHYWMLAWGRKKLNAVRVSFVLALRDIAAHFRVILVEECLELE